MQDMIDYLNVVFEGISRDELINQLARKKERSYVDTVLEKMHELVTKFGTKQSLGGYAFTVSQYIGGAISPRELEKMYKNRYMSESAIREWGRIVQGVNTTKDVGVDEIKIQAAKFGNKVDRDGRPPILGKDLHKIIPKIKIKEDHSLYSTNTLNEHVLYEGFLDSTKQFLGQKFNSTIEDVKGDVKTFIDAGIVIKDIIIDPEYLEKVSAQLGKKIATLLKQTEKLITGSQNTALITFWKRVKEQLIALARNVGWKGFLSRLGVYGFLRYIAVNTSNLSLNIFEIIFEKLVDLGSLLPNVSIGPFFAIFDAVVGVKTYFLEVLSDIKKRLLFMPSMESATSGGSSAGGIAGGATSMGVIRRTPPKSVNALDSGVNIFGNAAPSRKKGKKKMKSTMENTDPTQNMINNLERQKESYQKRIDDLQKRLDGLRDKQSKAQGTAGRAPQNSQTTQNSAVKESVKADLLARLSEKSSSKSQQMAAGAALAVKRGEKPASSLKGASKEMAKMSKKDLEDFAKTKHTGLPKKVKK